RFSRDWSSDVCSSDLSRAPAGLASPPHSAAHARAAEDPFAEYAGTAQDRMVAQQSPDQRGDHCPENAGFLQTAEPAGLYDFRAEIGRASCRERVELSR